ncbi:MAG TPA: hypothetical protein VG892_14645 [Terriglobales bacterium]|nr:hypothetical protein [Terriglobales bacterium]
MTNWKKAIVIGSFTAGALLAIKGKRPAAMAVSTVGLMVLAAEYPEKFDAVLEHAPDYVNRGVEIFTTLTELAERYAAEGSRRGFGAEFEGPRPEYAR